MMTLSNMHKLVKSRWIVVRSEHDGVPWQAKFGPKAAAGEKERIMSMVQEISQNLNLEFDNLKSQGMA
eukprot:7321219-Pyramimonas_sp.AAC.1